MQWWKNLRHVAACCACVAPPPATQPADFSTFGGLNGQKVLRGRRQWHHHWFQHVHFVVQQRSADSRCPEKKASDKRKLSPLAVHPWLWKKKKNSPKILKKKIKGVEGKGVSYRRWCTFFAPCLRCSNPFESILLTCRNTTQIPKRPKKCNLVVH